MDSLFLVLIVALFVILVVIPLIAGIIALVHAILDSVRTHKLPPVISMIFTAIALILGMIFLIGTFRYRRSGGIEMMCIGTLLWPNLRLILLAVGVVCGAFGLGYYIFLSYRSDNVSARDSKTSGNGERESEKNEDEQKEVRRTVLLYRILTIAVCSILTVIVFVYIFLTNLVLMDHEIIEYRSPDGDRTILVDNLTQTSVFIPDMVEYGGDVYLRTSPLFVRLLQEEEGRRKYITDLDPEMIQWYDDSVMIPYGQTYLIFYYDDYTGE